MSGAKSLNVLLGGHFKLLKAQTLTMEDETALMSEVPYASAMGKLDVCYSLYEARHCSSNGSCQQVYEQSQKGALERNKVNLENLKRSSDMLLAMMAWTFICTDMSTLTL